MKDNLCVIGTYSVVKRDTLHQIERLEETYKRTCKEFGRKYITRGEEYDSILFT